MRLGALGPRLILFRFGGLGLLAGSAAASAYGCEGGAFTLAPDAAEATTAGPDSGSLGDGNTPTSLDASTTDGEAGGFCSSYTSYTFCESFDEGVPGRLMLVSSGSASSGSISPDLSSSVAPSAESLEVVLPPVDAGGASARAFVGRSFMMLGTDLLLQAEFQVAKPCLSSDGVTLAIVTVGLFSAPEAQYSVAVTVGATSTDVVEILSQADGGTTLVPHAASGSTLVPSTWSDIELMVHLVKRTFDLTVGQMNLFKGEPLSEEPDAGAGQSTSASFAVGGSVTDTDAAAPACTVLVDNVLFNDTGL